MYPGVKKNVKIYNINEKINLTKMLTITKATFYLNKRHIQSPRSD